MPNSRAASSVFPFSRKRAAALAGLPMSVNTVAAFLWSPAWRYISAARSPRPIRSRTEAAAQYSLPEL